MHRVLVIGAGKIGTLIATLLSQSKQYQVYLADLQVNTPTLKELFKEASLVMQVPLDATNLQQMRDFLRKNPLDAVVSSLPYYCNIPIAELAKEFNLHYFDLTEDTEVAKTVTKLAHNAKTAFVPQCGLAPGFISIVAQQLMKNFSMLDTVKMRVGALPLHVSNGLQYALTWSTDGLINEYGNPCYAIENGAAVTTFPLEDVEEINLDGLAYEAFNTSGGAGSLAQSYLGQVQTLNYKTIRYPGHCAKMRFLMQELKLNDDRATLKRILEKALPRTLQDVVLVYVSVSGMQHGSFVEENYLKKFHPKKIQAVTWSAIQLTTASGLCAVLDMVLAAPEKYHGLVKQEQFSLTELTHNSFGQYYA